MRVPKAERQTKTESQKIWKWKVVHKMRRINAFAPRLHPLLLNSYGILLASCHALANGTRKYLHSARIVTTTKYTRIYVQSGQHVCPTCAYPATLPSWLLPLSQPSRWPSLAPPVSSHKPKPKANSNSSTNNNRRNARAKQALTHWHTPTYTHTHAHTLTSGTETV